MKRWDTRDDTETEDSGIDAFLQDVLEVCKKHNMTLGHEDEHGAFRVHIGASGIYTEWLLAAHIGEDL